MTAPGWARRGVHALMQDRPEVEAAVAVDSRGPAGWLGLRPLYDWIAFEEPELLS